MRTRPELKTVCVLPLLEGMGADRRRPLFGPILRTHGPVKARMVTIRSYPLEFGRTVSFQGCSPAFPPVALASIAFKRDLQGGLKAEVHAHVEASNQQEYEISAAVLNSAGELLGSACSPFTNPSGDGSQPAQTATLDFGASPAYAQAAMFLVGMKPRVESQALRA